MSEGPLTAPSTQKQRKHTQDDARRQREEDVKAMLSTPAGRRWLWHVLDGVAGLFGGSFSGEGALTSAYNEGRRAVGVALMTEAQRIAPARYVEMVTEQSRAWTDSAHIPDKE